LVARTRADILTADGSGVHAIDGGVANATVDSPPVGEGDVDEIAERLLQMTFDAISEASFAEEELIETWLMPLSVRDNSAGFALTLIVKLDFGSAVFAFSAVDDVSVVVVVVVIMVVDDDDDEDKTLISFIPVTDDATVVAAPSVGLLSAN
jgi:hypothetical protein